jgi:hypothetical protein
LFKTHAPESRFSKPYFRSIAMGCGVSSKL